jgi:mannosyltransferase
MNRTLWWMLPLLLWIGGFGLIGAGEDALWFDEFWSLFNAGGVAYEGPPLETPLGPLDIWRQVAEIDPIHPPGYAFAIAIWARFVGWSVFATRALSVLLGMLSVAVIFRLGTDLYSRQVGLMGAFLLATAAFYLHYTHELRMYTMLALLVGGALWGYWRLTAQRGGIFAGGVFFVCTAGLVYTQYLSLFVIVGIGVYHLLLVRKDRRWWVITGLALLAGGTYIPWVPVVWELLVSVSGGPDRAGVFTTRTILHWGTAILTNSLLVSPPRWLLSFVPVAVVLLLLATTRRDQATVFLGVNVLVTGLLMIAINAGTGMFIHIRYLVVMFPALLLIYAAGAVRLPRWVVGLVAVVWLVSGFLQYSTFEAQYNRDSQWALPWKDIATTLDGATVETDLILVQAAGGRSWWDYAQISQFYLKDNPANVTITPLRSWETIEDYQQQLIEQIGEAERIFHVIDVSQPANQLEAVALSLPDGFSACGSLPDLQSLRIEVYARPGLGCDF